MALAWCLVADVAAEKALGCTMAVRTRMSSTAAMTPRSLRSACDGCLVFFLLSVFFLLFFFLGVRVVASSSEQSCSTSRYAVRVGILEAVVGRGERTVEAAHASSTELSKFSPTVPTERAELRPPPQLQRGH